MRIGKPRPLVSIVSLVVVWLCGAPTLAQGVSVVKKPVATTTRIFDPARPPKDMPRLTPPEIAVTESKMHCGAEFRYTIVRQSRSGEQKSATVRVSGARVTLGLDVVFWLPTNIDARTRAHEEGHRRIAERFYVSADQTARELAAGYIGREFTATGADSSAAAGAAVNAALQKLTADYTRDVYDPMARVQDLFDRITDHGRKSISEDEAIERAMAQHQRERPATQRAVGGSSR